MKKVTVHEWNGMRIDLWRMDAGDTIPRHSHPHVHTTEVAEGKTEVEIFRDEGGETFTMNPGDPNFAFQAGVEHEIRAIEDGTIVVNLAHSVERIRSSPGQKGDDGGIAFDD